MAPGILTPFNPELEIILKTENESCCLFVFMSCVCGTAFQCISCANGVAFSIPKLVFINLNRSNFLN